MIKITFEIPEEFIAKKADPAFAVNEIMEAKGASAIMQLFAMTAMKELDGLVKGGKTEYVISHDNVGEKIKPLYDHSIGDICMLAALSEPTGENDEK